MDQLDGGKKASGPIRDDFKSHFLIWRYFSKPRTGYVVHREHNKSPGIPATENAASFSLSGTAIKRQS
eukprot:scaffold152_cov163-Amphora_coffeaeformis.AAC.7